MALESRGASVPSSSIGVTVLAKSSGFVTNVTEIKAIQCLKYITYIQLALVARAGLHRTLSTSSDSRVQVYAVLEALAKIRSFGLACFPNVRIRLLMASSLTASQPSASCCVSLPVHT